MKRLKPRNADTPGAPLKKTKQQVEEGKGKIESQAKWQGEAEKVNAAV